MSRQDENNRREIGTRAAARAQKPGRVSGRDKTIAADDARQARTKGIARHVRGLGRR